MKININKKIASIYAILSFFWVLPILFTNNLYRDDYVREIQNTTIWEYAGRPLASLLYKFLSLSPFDIFNLYPLPTILSIFCSTFGMYLLHNIFTKSINNNKFNLFILYVSVSFVFFNPFILQNWLYQYDVLSMIMALTLSILSFYLPTGKKYFFISILLMICSLSLYQPGTPIFVFLTLINNIIKLKEDNSKIFYSFYYGLIYIISHISYYLIVKFLLPITMVRGDILHSNSYFTHFKYNINQLLNIIGSLHISTIFILLFISILFLLSFIDTLKNNNKFYDKILSLLSLPLLIFFIWGPLSLLEEPLEFPREFMSCGIIISLFFILLIRNSYTKFISIISIPLLLYFYICLIAVEISQFEQNKYQNNQIDSMSYQLYQHKKLYNSLMIFSYGQMPKSHYMSTIDKYLPYASITSKQDYRWQIRYRMALKGMDYTDSTYSLLVTDSQPEWKRICIKKDPILNKIYSNDIYDIYFDIDKKYTIVWWKSISNDICKNQVLNKDPE